MRRRSTVLSFAMVFSGGVLEAAGSPEPPRDSVRFVDLDRLYFERTADPGAHSALHAAQVRRVVPAALPAERLFAGSALELGAEEAEPGGSAMLSVRDFRLPRSTGGETILRQVLDREHRITDQWWCLYDDGRRVECWYFAPVPSRTEGKLLAEYEILEVLAPAAGELVLRTCGAMFRPQGAWWWQGKDFAFTLTGSELKLDHVVGRFYFSRGYDLGRGEPPLSVSTERPSNGRIEMRGVDAIPPSELKRCGYRDPLLEEEPVTCEQLEQAAACLTADAKTRAGYRARSEPSFVERGGVVR